MPQLKNFEQIKKIRNTKMRKKILQKVLTVSLLGKKTYTSSYWTAVVKPENIS